MARPTAARPVFDAPVQVIRRRDGTITLFLPDGHRLVLTAEAALRSGAVLSRARPPAGPTGEVIIGDFGGPRAAPLGKPGAGAYMPTHHGPTDPCPVRQEEDRRRKPARAVRLSY